MDFCWQCWRECCGGIGGCVGVGEGCGVGMCRWGGGEVGCYLVVGGGDVAFVGGWRHNAQVVMVVNVIEEGLQGGERDVVGAGKWSSD